MIQRIYSSYEMNEMVLKKNFKMISIFLQPKTDTVVHPNGCLYIFEKQKEINWKAWDPLTSSETGQVMRFAHLNNVWIWFNHMSVSKQASSFVYDSFLLCFCWLFSVEECGRYLSCYSWCSGLGPKAVIHTLVLRDSLCPVSLLQ